MKSFNSIELLRFITLLPLIIVLTAMFVGRQSAPESEVIYLSADTSESIAVVQTRPVD